MPPRERSNFSNGVVMCVLLLRIIAKRESGPVVDRADGTEVTDYSPQER